MTSNQNDVGAILAEQRRRQVRFHFQRGAWFVSLPVLGSGLSAVGLIAARSLARDGVGLSTAKLVLLWFGLGHAAAEGLRTAEALRQGLGARLLGAPGVADDLEALSSVLRAAADQGVDFSLALRLHKKDSLQVVSSMERRQGRFW